jgi:hypothetical protein
MQTFARLNHTARTCRFFCSTRGCSRTCYGTRHPTRCSFTLTHALDPQTREHRPMRLPPPTSRAIRADWPVATNTVKGSLLSSQCDGDDTLSCPGDVHMHVDHTLLLHFVPHKAPVLPPNFDLFLPPPPHASFLNLNATCLNIAPAVI